MATNGTRYELDKITEDPKDWEFLGEHDVDIENFHVKSIFFFEDKLLMFARGKPRGVMEQCCSFLLVFNLILDKSGAVKDIDTDNYTYLKLDPIVYIQYLARPTVNRKGNDLIIRAPMEDNYSFAFPRQIYELTVPGGDFTRSASFINTQY